jgi:hypothetical protein
LNNTNSSQIKPFEADIINSDYSMAHAVLIVLTNKQLKIVFKSEMVGARDSLLFSIMLPVSDTLRQLSEIKFSELKEYYSNPCIQDGSQITVIFKKDGKLKSVHLSNYYEGTIGKLIYLVNSFLPKDYEIWYDKEKLQADYKKCSGLMN